jgi:hypothetical protein
MNLVVFIVPFIVYCDGMMHVHTCVTDNTTYTKLYIMSLCVIWWWMYTRVLLIISLTPFTVIIGYIMNLVVFIVPFIVYCVIRRTYMYVYKLNMRDTIWCICLWYYVSSFSKRMSKSNHSPLSVSNLIWDNMCYW